MAPKGTNEKTADKPAVAKIAIVRLLLDTIAPGGTMEQRLTRVEVMTGMVLLHAYAPTIASWLESTASAMWSN